MRFAVAFLFCLFIASLPAPASADDLGSGAGRRWYGWQTLVGVGAADPVLVGSIAMQGKGGDGYIPLFVSGASLKVLSGPVVHLTHHRYRAALLSLGVTLGAASLFAVVGGGLDSFLQLEKRCTSAEACNRPLVQGLLIGAFVGATIGNIADVSVLSYDAPKRDRAEASRLGVAPFVTGKGGGLAVGGSF